MRRYLWIVLPGLMALAPPAAAGGYPTIDEVRDMAFAKGVVTIEEIELDDGIWEVRGRDEGGHKIKMEVEARSGMIVKLKRR
jgi:hypothetical protein